MLVRWIFTFLLLGVSSLAPLMGESVVLFPFTPGKEPALSELDNARVHGSRLKTGGSQLSMGVETYFLVPHSPEVTLKKLKNLTSLSQGDTTNSFGIEKKSLIKDPARASDFSGFHLTGKEARFGLGGSDMLTLKTKNLNLSKKEVTQLKKAKKKGTDRLEVAWKKLFANRSQDFQQGGLLNFTPYETTSQPFHHRAELVTLLLSTPKILNNFKSLIGAIMTGKMPEEAYEPLYTWESTKVQGEQTIALMCLVSAPHENGRIQIVETSFYVTGNYYTSLILHELVPVYDDKTGKEQTLVWRGDYVITESIGFLKGIERIAAENIMMQEVVNSVEGFVDSVSK